MFLYNSSLNVHIVLRGPLGAELSGLQYFFHIRVFFFCAFVVLAFVGLTFFWMLFVFWLGFVSWFCIVFWFVQAQIANSLIA